MNPLQDIKHAIDQLSAAERGSIAAWILESGHSGDHVAESALAYGAALEHNLLSAEDYLKFEEQSGTRHEYIAGEIFAMSGVSMEHNLIAGNVYRAFAGHLHGGPCKTFISDFKVRLKSNLDEIFYYPDLVVACGRDGMEKYYLRNPKVIVEVLSPSTEGTDRREKLVNYRRIRTLEEYVLIAQDKPQVTVYRRSARWEPIVLADVNAIAEFQSLDLSLRLSDVYDGVL